MSSNYSFNAFGPAVVGASYTFQDGTFDRLEAARRIVNRAGFRASTALLNGLIGAATGSNVTATHKEIAHASAGRSPIGDRGGKIVAGTVTDINRNTAAADVTALKAFLYNVKTAPSTYPVNRNGLGQKQF